MTTPNVVVALSSSPWMRDCESAWAKENRQMAWVDPTPVRCSAGDWGPYVGDGFPPPPTRPSKRALSISLIGGGTITVTENWQACGPWLADEGWLFETQIGRTWPLEFHAQMPLGKDRLAYFSGNLQRVAGVQTTMAVVMEESADKDRSRSLHLAAQIIARTLRAINHQPEHFHAMLGSMSSHQCAICDGAGWQPCRVGLKTDLERALSVSAECARKFNIPFSQEAAARRLALRITLLTP